MKVLNKYGVNFLVWVILTGMIMIRLSSYGDFNLSVANADTASYIDGAATPLFSKNMFIKSRLFTTNMVYHLAGVQGCEIQAVSYPALGKEVYRVIQPCFNRIALIQNIISIIAWSILALVVSKRLSGGYEKLLAVSMITGFGFTPSIADWDSILGSESLTFSLFAITVALIVEICFNVYEDGNESGYAIFINLVAMATLVLWAFIRDANIYTLIVLLAISVIPFISLPNIRKDKNVLILITVIFIITIVGMKSALKSRRWETPIRNVFNEYILSYPARMDFMQYLGMPDPTSTEFSKWFVEDAPWAYTRFLLSHPGFTLTFFTTDMEGIFSENIQPYFFSEQTSVRKALIAVNDILHPSTHLVFILDILIMAGLIFSALRRKNKTLLIWVWLGAWLFFSTLLTLVVSFFADSIGITRHTLFSVEMFRLMMWIFLIILFDQTNQKNEDVLVA